MCKFDVFNVIFTDLETLNIYGSSFTGSMPNGVCPDMDDCTSIECSCCLCVNDVLREPSTSPASYGTSIDEHLSTSSPSGKESSKSTVGTGTLAAVSGAVSQYGK